MDGHQILTDLYDVLTSQQRLLSYFFKSQLALVETLVNESSLKHFDERFSQTFDYLAKHGRPKDELFQSLAVMQRKLDAIGETLKRDKGGWEN